MVPVYLLYPLVPSILRNTHVSLLLFVSCLCRFALLGTGVGRGEGDMAVSKALLVKLLPREGGEVRRSSFVWR